jgi:hypothetical protein
MVWFVQGERLGGFFFFFFGGRIRKYTKKVKKIGVKMASLSEKISNWLKLEEFTWSFSDQPHVHRRNEIRKKYPKVAELEGIDPNTKYWVVLVVLIQFIMAYYIKDAPLWLYCVAIYCVGGTLNHSLFLVRPSYSFDAPHHPLYRD